MAPKHSPNQAADFDNPQFFVLAFKTKPEHPKNSRSSHQKLILAPFAGLNSGPKKGPSFGPPLRDLNRERLESEPKFGPENWPLVWHRFRARFLKAKATDPESSNKNIGLSKSAA